MGFSCRTVKNSWAAGKIDAIPIILFSPQGIPPNCHPVAGFLEKSGGGGSICFRVVNRQEDHGFHSDAESAGNRAVGEKSGSFRMAAELNTIVGSFKI
jgi:hypothetical protein